MAARAGSARDRKADSSGLPEALGWRWHRSRTQDSETAQRAGKSVCTHVCVDDVLVEATTCPYVEAIGACPLSNDRRVCPARPLVRPRDSLRPGPWFVRLRQRGLYMREQLHEFVRVNNARLARSRAAKAFVPKTVPSETSSVVLRETLPEIVMP